MGNIENLAKLFEPKIVKFKKGEAITNSTEIDYIWLVKKGFVKRFEIIHTGAHRIQSFYGPNDIFSLSDIFVILFDRKLYHGPETYFYEALNNVELQKLKGTALLEAVEKDPFLYKDLFSLTGNRFVSNIQKLENHGLSDAPRKVAHLILFYAKRFGITKDTNVSVPMPFTQQDIADILGLTRETVSTSMSQLRKQHLIKGHKNIVVNNIDDLEDAAYN